MKTQHLVRVFSDLHIEFDKNVIQKCIDIAKTTRKKYTILAGDITNFQQRNIILPELVNGLKKYTDNILFTLGNHEYYNCDNASSYDVKMEYKRLCDNLGIHMLENSSLETDDFVFYGATLWSNVNDDAYKKMNDRYSFRSKEEVINMHKESLYHIEKYTKEYTNEKDLVMITHYLPSFKLIDDIYKHYGSLNSGFASECDYLIKNPVKYWIYGHTHKPSKTIINDVQLICNPHGYPKEQIDRVYEDCTF